MTQPKRPRLRRLHGTRRMWIGVSATIVVLIAVAVLAVWLRQRDDGASEEPTTDPELRFEYEGEGFEVWLARDFLMPPHPAIVVDPDGAQPVVMLIDLDTGQKIAQISTGRYPHAVLRPSRGELLLSDRVTIPSAERTSFRERLLVLDMKNGMRIKEDVTLDGRSVDLASLQAMSLTSDGRRLIYHARQPATTCTGGETPCTGSFVGIVDLDVRDPEATLLPYGDEHCGPPVPEGDWLAAAVCAGDAIDTRIDLTEGTSGPVGDLAQPEHGPIRALVEFGHVAGALYEDGTILGDGFTDRIIPEGTVIPPQAAPHRMGGRLIIPYASAAGAPLLDGVSVYHIRENRVEATIPLARTVDVVPRSDGTWLLQRENGTVALYTYAGGREQTVVSPAPLLHGPLTSGPAAPAEEAYLVP